MRAVEISKPGGPDVLRLADAAKPARVIPKKARKAKKPARKPAKKAKKKAAKRRKHN